MLLCLGIILGSLIVEDAALLATFALYKQGQLPLWASCSALAFGITLGDFVLYYLGKYIVTAKKVKRVFTLWVGASKIESIRKKLDHSSIKKWGNIALFLARFIPGTRLPTYLGAGLLEMPTPLFTLITVFSTVIWISGAALITTRMLPFFHL